ARLLRVPPPRHPARSEGAVGCRVWTREDVRGRGARDGDDPGAGAMMSSPLSITEHPTHVLARLNRPEKKNAIDSHLVAALHELCAELETTPRTLILTGAGDSFAAGDDIEELRARGPAQEREGNITNAYMRVNF